MKTVTLSGIWKLRGRDATGSCPDEINIDAKVPGCVQLDLSDSGYLPSDLYMGENILETEKYECYEWWYERSFEYVDEANRVYLVFEGVDCIAEYFLNGKKIGESSNMLIAHEFRVDEYIKRGENILTVHIKSPILETKKEEYTLKMIQSMHSIDGRCIRKPPHSFGWDIMPRAVTSGLWRDVRLEVRDEICLSQVFINKIYGKYRVLYDLETDLNSLDDVELEIYASSGESIASGRQKIKRRYGFFFFKIENPKLWYPYGYGEPNMYDGYVRIYKNGELTHEKQISFGLRDVKLDRRDRMGEDPGQFRILVNGAEIMCKGSNWVPLDAFHSRDAEKYDRALELARDIGCNILRCWGGNVYEDHKFFDFCDRNGIMVWQDFAMACAAYPETEEFKKALHDEVSAVIKKLRMHPCIVLWSGDNEVDDVIRQNDTNDPDDNSLTRGVIAKCVDENDMGRPYLPSSPYITSEQFRRGVKSQVHGSPLVEDHLWGPRDYFKSDFYSQNKAHFISETGYHGCPSFESIKKFITPERVWPYHKNPEWILHSTDQNGNDARLMLLEKQVRQLFGYIPTEPEEFILASQISQAEADKYLIERMRVGRPDKTGIIWWNLLDGWPQISDAVVDYFFEKKLAYRYVKRSQAPFTVAAGELSNWHLPIYACNDTLQNVSGTLKITDAFSDEVLYEGCFAVGENRSETVAKIPLYYSDKTVLIFEWCAGGEYGRNHYLCGYPPYSIDDYKKVMDKYEL